MKEKTSTSLKKKQDKAAAKSINKQQKVTIIGTTINVESILVKAAYDTALTLSEVRNSNLPSILLLQVCIEIGIELSPRCNIKINIGITSMREAVRMLAGTISSALIIGKGE